MRLSLPLLDSARSRLVEKAPQQNSLHPMDETDAEPGREPRASFLQMSLAALVTAASTTVQFVFSESRLLVQAASPS
jgi:hypothetical protein